MPKRGAVLGAAAVGVVAAVRRGREELVQEVPVGRVQLDAVETGAHRPARGGDELVAHVSQLGGRQPVRHRIGLLPGRGAHLAVDRDGARRHDAVGTGDVGVRDAAAVHQLHHETPARAVDGVGDAGPAGLLGVVDDARLAGVGARLPARVAALGDDQARRGALAVVLDVQVVRHARLPGAQARQRRHDDAVGERDVAEGEVREEVDGVGRWMPCRGQRPAQGGYSPADGNPRPRHPTGQ